MDTSVSWPAALPGAVYPLGSVAFELLTRRPLFESRSEMAMMKMADGVMGGNQTLAVGEIEITSQVSVSFYLE